ncbi:STAS domain-containing protein [Halomonas sp. Bachu 37]|uniref:STAS domain-containing protein n=1 Tax=Halomonas kashgarensis TaxID=3084920 RepID=UPI003216EB06
MSVLLDLQSSRLEVNEPDTIMVVGDVHVLAASRLAEAGNDWLSQLPREGHVVLDFSRVEKASTAALSVLLQWVRAARRRHLSITAIILSSPLRRLSALADITPLLDEVVVPDR